MKKQKKKNEEAIETHDITPNMAKFLYKLAQIKEKIKQKSDETNDYFLQEILSDINKIFSPEVKDFDGYLD